eukprot:907102-Pyramimonas_sp.AAC.1
MRTVYVRLAFALLVFPAYTTAGKEELSEWDQEHEQPPKHSGMVGHHVVTANNVVPTWNNLQKGYKDHEHRNIGAPCDNEATCVRDLCLCLTAGYESGFFNPVVGGDTPQTVTDPGGLSGLFRVVQDMQDVGGFVHLVLGTLPGAGDLHLRKLWE